MPLPEHAFSPEDLAPYKDKLYGALKDYFRDLAQPPDFKRDFVSSMSGVQNIMSPHMYNQGALPLWGNVISDPNYYPVRSDEEILSLHAERIRELARDPQGRPVIHVEQGMGDEHAVLHKTIPTFDLLGAEYFVAMDFSDAALVGGALHMLQNRPQLEKKLLLLRRNFNTQSYNIPFVGRKVITQLGLTIGNNPDRDITPILQHYRQQMNDGDILIFSVDRNMDTLSLHRAYNKTFGIWVDDMRRELAAQFSGMGYNPKDFEYRRFWDAQTTSFHFGFQALRDGHIMNDGERIDYKKGQNFWYLPSRRYRQETLDGYYRKAGGLELAAVLPDSRNFVSWQVLKAVPFRCG